LVADIKATILFIVGAHAKEEDWNKLKALFLKAEMNEDKVTLLRALGSAADEKLITHALDFAMSENVRNQDVPYVVFAATGSAKGREVTWKYFKDNFATFQKHFSQGSFLLNRIVSYITSTFTSEEKAKEIESFFKDHPVPEADRSIAQSLETVRSKSARLHRDRDDVAKFLKEHK